MKLQEAIAELYDRFLSEAEDYEPKKEKRRARVFGTIASAEADR